MISVLLVAGPNTAVWISDSGFWLLCAVWLLQEIIPITRRFGSAGFCYYCYKIEPLIFPWILDCEVLEIFSLCSTELV